jgi:hypothetical protein
MHDALSGMQMFTLKTVNKPTIAACPSLARATSALVHGDKRKLETTEDTSTMAVPP